MRWLCLLLWPLALQAQPLRWYVPDVVHPEDTYMLFVHVKEPLRPLTLKLPDGWHLERATLTTGPWPEPLTFAQRGTRATLNLPTATAFPLWISLEIRTGPLAEGTVDVLLNDHPSPPIQILQATTAREVLHLEGSHRWALPVATAPPYTLSGWLKTTRFPALIASSWDGQLTSPYSMELMVDGRGFLQFFCGDGRDHWMLASDAPVADGTWHHVAVVHGLDSLHLWIDGREAGSMANRCPDGGMPLWVGGRPTLQTHGFVGYLAGWSLTGHAMNREILQALPYRPGCLPEGYCLDTDADLPRRRIPLETPSFFTLLEALPQDDRTVQLFWKVRGTPPEGHFRVERALDGRSYEPVAELSALHGQQGAYMFTDYLPEPAGVVYYRIRFHHAGGEQLSGWIKLGRAGTTPSTEPRLVLYPNPARQETRVLVTLQQDEYVRLSLWDMSGQLREILHEGLWSAGEHALRYAVDPLPAGAYIIRLETSRGVHTATLLVTH